MNEIMTGSIFILSTADALYCICIHGKTWCDRINCFGHFDQDAVLSNVDSLEKQARYKQEEQKRSFQPTWQLKRPWFSFAPSLSVLADSCNYGHDVLGNW